ncbi:MAG TPA: metallophosphoesterase [Bacteroidales bacterium]|nr:metallophosphoesterase [Bacteroidales bacterium]
MLIFFLILSEILTFTIIRNHFKGISRTRYYLTMVANAAMSIFFWILFTEVTGWNESFDDARHIWLIMNLNGAYAAIFVPRLILIILHFTGIVINYREGGHLRRMTNAGFIVWLVILFIVVSGTFYGRFNVKTEHVTVRYENLNPDLEGLTIVQISDLHLASFHVRADFLEKQVAKINGTEPDIIINSGDFISYGWREFGRMDTVLAKLKGRMGSFAVFGNHDMGTYHPSFSPVDRKSHLLMMENLICRSGFVLLKDDGVTIRRGNAEVSISGITTSGRHGHITYGDLNKATAGRESSDFNILISHDPNHWRKYVTGRFKADLTLAGHTHGMQLGIYTGFFRWSPSEIWYPEWNGLYSENQQNLYVNRGLGVLGVPFRIWMPPEITVIKIAGRH